MDTLPKFFTRCRILPAEPHIEIDTGRQTDELIYDKDPERALDQRRALENRGYNIVPVHMLAAENHDTLVREHFEACEQGLMCRGDHPVIAGNFINSPLLKPLIMKALEQACVDKGITEKYEDKPYRRGFKYEWLLAQLPELATDSQEYYTLVAKACIASEYKELFLGMVEAQLDNVCEAISQTDFHTGDDIHLERAEALRRCFVVDPSTGTLYCDAKIYPHLVEEIAQEKSQAFAQRITELRTKMQQAAERLDTLVNRDDKAISMIKRAQRRQGARIGDDPFSKPLSQEEAKEAILTALEKINAPPLVERLMQIALNDENLVISVSTNEKHIENIYGDSLDERKSEYIMGSSDKNVMHLPKNPETWTLVEELMHHALRLMYDNDCKPYTRNNDQRKPLYIAAIKEDFRHNGAGQAKKDFELTTYQLNSFSCEIVAKALAMMASGDWDNIKDRYPHIERHIDYILKRDIETYDQKGYVQAYGTHVVKAATISSGGHVSGRPHSPT